MGEEKKSIEEGFVEIRRALDQDFKEYLGEYVIHISPPKVSITGSNYTITAEGLPGDLPRLVWRAVAKAWLLEESMKPDSKMISSGRGVQNHYLPLPTCRSDKESDIRWRYLTGKEILA